MEYFWHVITVLSNLPKLHSLYITYPKEIVEFSFEARIITTMFRLKFLNGSSINDDHRRACEEKYLHQHAGEVLKENHPRLDMLKQSNFSFSLVEFGLDSKSTFRGIVEGNSPYIQSIMP